MKKFQDCNRIVKIWRYRWYLYIPFKFIRQYTLLKFEDLVSKEQDFKVNAKTLWSLLIGSAQYDMKWYYTSDEVEDVFKSRIKTKLDKRK